MRLIDAETLKNKCDEYDWETIDKEPTVEAIPVEWIKKFRNQFDEADDFYDLLDTMLTIWERCKEENEG